MPFMVGRNLTRRALLSMLVAMPMGMAMAQADGMLLAPAARGDLAEVERLLAQGAEVDVRAGRDARRYCWPPAPTMLRWRER